ncbi:hypothetical protein TNCV_4717761 [Trichonephila clavipes]|nr:hypothetical protein TNCV_4717761 [Trichonephila clavipes]
MVRRWVRDFKNGRTDVHDEARAGRPSASDETIAKVEAAMLEDRRTTVRTVRKDSKTTIDKILTEHLGFSAQDGPGYTTPHRKQRSNRSSGNTLRRQEQRVQTNPVCRENHG